VGEIARELGLHARTGRVAIVGLGGNLGHALAN
jgi:hypothetical protein